MTLQRTALHGSIIDVFRRFLWLAFFIQYVLTFVGIYANVKQIRTYYIVYAHPWFGHVFKVVVVCAIAFSPV